MSDYSEDVRVVKAHAQRLGYKLVPMTPQAGAHETALRKQSEAEALARQSGYASLAHKQRDPWGERDRIIIDPPERP